MHALVIPTTGVEAFVACSAGVEVGLPTWVDDTEPLNWEGQTHRGTTIHDITTNISGDMCMRKMPEVSQHTKHFILVHCSLLSLNSLTVP